MIEPIVYHNISEKKISNEVKEPLLLEEAFIRALDLVDFFAVLSNNEYYAESKFEDDKPWIELSWDKK